MVDIQNLQDGKSAARAGYWVNKGFIEGLRKDG